MLDQESRSHTDESWIIRASLETATDRYLSTHVYYPSDDLIALVRCWKIATQLATYKAVKAWRHLADDQTRMRATITAYWNRQRDIYDDYAEREDYEALKAYFRDPHFIEPRPPAVPTIAFDGSDAVDEEKHEAHAESQTDNVIASDDNGDNEG